MVNFYNPYMTQGNYMTELQNMRDRIDSQIQQAQQQQQNMTQMPMQQPTNLTQNFQLANNASNNNFRLVNSVEDVEKEIVLGDTYFLANNIANLWIKKSNGDIRSFNIEEILQKDEKDLLIESLQKQINELKGGKSNEFTKSNGELLYEQSNAEFNNNFGEQFETKQPSDVPIISNSKTTKRKS